MYVIYSHLLLFYYFLNCFSSLITHCLILWYFTWQITCVRMNAICWYQVAVNITHLSLPLGHISIFFFSYSFVADYSSHLASPCRPERSQTSQFSYNLRKAWQSCSVCLWPACALESGWQYRAKVSCCQFWILLQSYRLWYERLWILYLKLKEAMHLFNVQCYLIAG